MTPEETAFGWVFGMPGRDSRPPKVDGMPLDAINGALLPALAQSPCVVMFSGGRDSSAVLAAAMALARAEGLPEPVALTYTYPPGSPADETEWQERVIQHLGVTEWMRLPVSDQLDLVGPEAGPALLEHGPGFPPASYGHRYAFRQVTGGAIVTGDLGDEVFGPHRASYLYPLRRRGALKLARWRAAMTVVAPRPLRYRRLLDLARSEPHGWLQPELEAGRRHLMATDLAAAPFDWRQAIWQSIHRRAITVGLATIDRVASEFGATIYRPLMDLEFVARFGRAGGLLGYPGRRQGMSSVFGDLLPADVLARVSKAVFNESRFGPHSRAFAEQWDGSGVDVDLVDPQRLRQEWLSPQPHGGSAALLQQAWLADRERAGRT
jgi:asparagine synthase (glutamine-hydrolysing)